MRDHLTSNDQASPLSRVPMGDGQAWTFTFRGWEYRVTAKDGEPFVRMEFRTSSTGRFVHSQDRPLEGRSAYQVAEWLHTRVTGS